MRQIAFRMWRKNQKKMFEVGDIRFGVRHGMGSSDLANYVGTPYGSEYYVEGYDVELMQFIGLLDVTRQEIYEGDIVKTPLKHQANTSLVCEVVWDQQRASFLGRDSKGRFHEIDGQQDVCPWRIIGNIYEHPHLLEASHDS